MKQYVYTPEECKLDKFSDGTLRLNCEETRDPDQASVFVCPEALFKFTSKYDLGRRLPYLFKAPNVFLDLSEHFTQYDQNWPIFIRAALTKGMLEWGPNSISWPWPVKDYRDCMPVQRFNYDVTFHGWASNLARKVSAKACAANHTIRHDIITYPNFFGYQTPDEQARRDQLYRRGMKFSRMCLTQQSIIGVFPYRFFEAMSAGRCQLYIGHDFNLPFEDKIDYHDFVSFLHTDQADEADRAVKDWIGRYDDRALIEKGKRARQAWERWLQPDKWVDLMTYAVEEKLNQIQGTAQAVRG